jgi:hypothetical protein
MSATCIFEGAREASITLINIAAFSETEPGRRKKDKKKTTGIQTKRENMGKKNGLRIGCQCVF